MSRGNPCMRSLWVAAFFLAFLLGVMWPPSGRGESSLGETNACYGEAEPAWPTNVLRDWTSFSDQVSVVRVLSEREDGDPPPAGEYLSRRVDVRVQRPVWRRPGAPRAPARLSVTDWGWCQTDAGRVPMLVEGATRLQPGQRYLAPLAESRGVWTTFDDGRMRLEEKRIVGGVDFGEPTIAHRELLGLSVRHAARVLRRTLPYRGAVRAAREGPVSRWNATYRDRYRVWKRPKAAYIVAVGATSRSRWGLHARQGEAGRICLELHARPRGALHPAVRLANCGRHRPSSNSITAYVRRTCRGQFAYGKGGGRVASVELELADGRSVGAALHPIPLTVGRGFTWIAPLGVRQAVESVRAVDRAGGLLARARLGRARVRRTSC